MKRNIYIGICLFCLVLVFACREAEREMYPLETEGLYFHADSVAYFDTNLLLRTDTVVYTFAYETTAVQTYEVRVPVQLMGVAAERERIYYVEILPADNTVEGTDYEPVTSRQVFAAGKTVDTLRIVWKRNKSMEKGLKQLNIHILEGGDFTRTVEERNFIALQASDILEEPDWWKAWEIAFGSYHPTKLREWVKIWGREPLEEDPWMGIYFMGYPQECTAILKLRDLFEKEEFYDDNGVRLVIPANF